jgi:DNA-binding MarR family transcriptional regulator
MMLGELARRLRLDKSWTSRAIDQLVGDGLVEKTSGERDRRTIALALTPAGEAHHRRLESLLDGQVARIISRVPKAERAGVARALDLLHQAYVTELATDADDQSEAPWRARATTTH